MRGTWVLGVGPRTATPHAEVSPARPGPADRAAHTPDLAEDLPSADVGRAFGVTGSTVTGWREELAEYVYLERGHQHLVRDLVLMHGLMTRADVAEADRYVAELRRGA